MRWAFAGLIFLSGCVSSHRYWRDIDKAELAGELRMLNKAQRYVSQYRDNKIDQKDLEWILNSNTTTLRLRQLSNAWGRYYYPDDYQDAEFENK